MKCQNVESLMTCNETVGVITKNGPRKNLNWLINYKHFYCEFYYALNVLFSITNAELVLLQYMNVKFDELMFQSHIHALFRVFAVQSTSMSAN